MTSIPRRFPPIVVDALIACGLFAAAIVGLAVVEPGPTTTFSRGLDAGAVLVSAAMTLPLVARRRAPAVVVSIISVGFIADRLLDYPITVAIWGIPIALYTVGSEMSASRGAWVGWTASAVLVAFTGLGAATDPDVDLGTVAIMAVFTMFPYLIGREVKRRRVRTAALEERAHELERRRDELAEQTLRRERTRIARELHDIVAHEMTVMTIQAAAARRVIHHDPNRADAALQAVEDAGHDALNEMRRLLGVLRPATNDEARTPQPGLGRLDELVAQMAEAELSVDVEIKGDIRDLPPGIDLNAYRIVQESLTNALKHGGPHTSATVQIAYDAESLKIEVCDDGRGAAEALVARNGTGHGLVGMRERAALLNGELIAGPRSGGGYRVQTRIPLDKP